MTNIETTTSAGRSVHNERSAEGSPQIKAPEVKVWDIAVRLFHWSLVASFVVAWLTADEWDWLHEVSGYTIGGLLLFRFIWGVIGTKHARFSDFIYGPMSILRYLRQTVVRKARRYIGHNPAGGAMVLALLLSLVVITITGIAMTSQTYWGVEWIEELHEISANLILILIALHIVGVIYSSFEHRENLVRSMITGWKRR
ncbi:MAG: cytochrome b/b6 domain-containing protein [Rhizobiaceae bacterium]|nr:cytochrome b/b6 domain-containing protein [Rhizobiaceae bacterium]